MIFIKANRMARNMIITAIISRLKEIISMIEVNVGKEENGSIVNLYAKNDFL